MRRTSALAVTVCLLTSGCETFSGLSQVPLPGGPDFDDRPRLVTIKAGDVLSLSRQSAVKVNDVTVGEVEQIRRDGWNAELVVKIRGDVDLPANAVAAVRQTGVLGEKYVELAPPVENRVGTLDDGATIGMDRYSRSYEIEEILGALSLLLNGGGIERLRTITVELNKALGGREKDFRDFLTRLNTFSGTLSDNRQVIVDAIDGLDRLSATTASGSRTIEEALDTLGPALEVLADQRKDLVRMLEATSELADVSVDTIEASREDFLANLEALQPILTQLAKVGGDIPAALTYVLTFPFPTDSFQALQGDYFNFDLEARLREVTLPVGGLPIPPVGAAQAPAKQPSTPGTQQMIPGLPIPAIPHPNLSPVPQVQPEPSTQPHPGGLLGYLLGRQR